MSSESKVQLTHVLRRNVNHNSCIFFILLYERPDKRGAPLKSVNDPKSHKSHRVFLTQNTKSALLAASLLQQLITLPAEEELAGSSPWHQKN